jgi:hypothetical protein
MANELNIALTTGLTVTCQPYAAGAASGSAIPLSEVGSSGFYTGNMTGSAGTYQLVFFSGGATVGTGQINWSGTAEVPVSTLTTGDLPSVPSAASVASAVRTEMDSNSTKLANLDATISSRLASASYTAPANSDISAIKSKTDNLPSDPADQSLLEAAIAGITAPSANTVASAVRSELTAELAKVSALNTERLANVATTAIVGNLIAQANS